MKLLMKCLNEILKYFLSSFSLYIQKNVLHCAIEKLSVDAVRLILASKKIDINQPSVRTYIFNTIFISIFQYCFLIFALIIF